MTVATVIDTHGWTAEQPLRTAEMPLDEQENVGWINFVPGENTETLVEECNTQLAKLDASKGALFLIDTWRSSPLSTTSRIIVDREHYEIIVGVNIPMLVETFMARDDSPSFDELVALTVETGNEGVKALKAKPVEKVAPAPTPTTAPKAAAPTKPMNPSNYMVISLARIDDRLIHGQVAAHWTKETNVTRIIVISDEVAADAMCKTLLIQVAPSSVTTHVVDVARIIRVYNNLMYVGQHVILLFTNPTDVEHIIEGGVKITSVNIGGMAFRQGKAQVDNAISVDAKDIGAFNKLSTRGIKLEACKVSADPKLKMMDLIVKVDK